MLTASPDLKLWGWLEAYRRAEGELFPGLTLIVSISFAVILDRRNRRARPEPSAGATIGPRLGALRRALLAAAVGACVVSASTVVAGPWRLGAGRVTLLSVGDAVKPLTLALALGLMLLMTSTFMRRAYAASSLVGFYATVAFTAWVLSLGPAPTIMGRPFMYRGPYWLLTFLPGFDALRVPARFWMTATLALAVAAAVLFDRVAPRGGVRRAALVLVIAAGAFADAWAAPLLMAPMPRFWAAEQCLDAAGPLVELPLGDNVQDAAAMYRGIRHRHAVVNGYSGYLPPHYAALRYGLSGREDGLLTRLAAHGVGYVAVGPHASAGPLRSYVAAQPGTALICDAADGTALYRLRAPGVPAPPQTPAGPALPVAHVWSTANEQDLPLMLDGNPATRWWSEPHGEGSRLDIDLGEVRTVAGLELWLGRFADDFPRRLSIEGSAGGDIWDDLYRGPAAGRVFDAALASPIDIPLPFTFAPARVRYLRIRSFAGEETYRWSVVELRVRGS